MRARTHNGVRYRSRDYFWWGLAFILGLASMWIPRLLTELDPASKSVFVFGALFLGGTALGFCRPDRPWRWGLASLLVSPVGDLAWSTHDPLLDVFSLNQLLPYLAGQWPEYAIQALPVLLGAYVGSFLAAGFDTL